MNVPHPLRSICVAAFLCFQSCFLASVSALPNDGSRSAGVNQDDSAGQLSPTFSVETVVIPGPLRSFLRMAGISQKVSLDEVMPMLAHGLSLQGYKGGRETEFLRLLDRYVHLATQVRSFSDANGMIHIAGCADASRLIEVLGYRSRGTCGQRDFAFVTADAERAFLTIDSGFPLTALEEALQKSEPFDYLFPASRVPILYTEKDWMAVAASTRKPGSNLVEMLLHDRTISCTDSCATAGHPMIDHVWRERRVLADRLLSTGAQASASFALACRLEGLRRRAVDIAKAVREKARRCRAAASSDSRPASRGS